MKVVFVINEQDIELMDRDIMFEEGDQIIVDKQTLRVHSVVKAITITGNNAECVYRVSLS